jgi:hypothetical protein
MKYVLGLLACLALPASALAQTTSASDDAGGTSATRAAEAKDVRREIPILAYTYAAHGVSAKTIGVQAYGLGLVARGQDGALGGGGAVWLSPIDRLTLVMDGQRNVARDFSPSAAAVVRLFGDGREGFTLGALGKFKIDGFGKGPNGDEVESELEMGALLSFAEAGWHVDANGIAGRGIGDEGEMDAEGRLRLGRDIGSWVRVGLDGQARARGAGPMTLANGRTWDFAAGAQVLAYSGPLFGSLTTGPTTTGLVTNNVGFTAMLSVGAAAF